MKSSEKSNLIIRSAKITDMGEIAKILRELGWFENINEEPAQNTVNRLISYFELCEKNPYYDIFVVEKSGVVVGYINVHWIFYLFLNGPEGLISDLFIKEAERGKGIGRILLNEVKKKAEMKGCSRLMLLNNRNRLSYEKGFYKKNGWKEREHIANFVYYLS